MESINVMAKISHGGGGSVGSIKSHRRRIVSEPTDSLLQVLTCDDNNTMKLGNLSPNNLLIRNDLHGERRQLQVHNTLISTPPSSMLISNGENDMEGAPVHLVSGSSDLFCGKPLQIDLEHHRIGSHNGTPQEQPHHIGMVKALEKKDLIPHGAGCATKGLLQIVNGQQLQKQQHSCNECDRLFTRPERLRQHHAYKHTGNNNVGNNGSSSGSSNGNNMSPTPVGTHLNDDPQQVISQTTQQHECGQCGKAFCSKVQLGRHVKIHSGEKAFLCSQCEQSFHRKDHLKTHEKTHQSNNDKAFFECDRVECGKTYNSYSSYMKHRKTHEIAESSLAGGGINGGIKQTMTLTQQTDVKYRHNSTGAPHQTTLSVGSSIQLKDTADNTPMTITSSSSSSAGPTLATITPSRRSHREQGEKRFQCMQCSKKFPTSKDLKRHDVVHTGNREFQCSFCSHRFGRKDHRMRHEKKTHALELSNQQQNLNNVSGGSVTSGSHTTSVSTSINNSGSINQSSTQNNSSSTTNITSNNLQSSSSLTASQATSSSPCSTSSPVSPPSLIPIHAVSTSPPPTNTTFAIQSSNSCISPNSLSHPYSPPSHQFQMHDQLQTKINVLALSPPPTSNTSSPCQIVETTIPSNQLAVMVNDNEPISQHFGILDAKQLQANKRWRHVSSPSTLQQVQPPSSNIHILHPNAIPSSLRTNTALFPNIIVVENTTNGISCNRVNSGNRVILRKNDDPIDINTLLAEQSIGNTQTDAMMISPKPEPPENEDFFQMCDNVSENNVLEDVRALAQHQQQPGEMILSQIKEEKDEKCIVQQQCYNIENQLLMSDQQQPLANRIQTTMSNNDPSMLLTPLPLVQNLIKNDFLLKKEDVEEQMDDEMMDDQPHPSLSTQLQQSVRLKSETDDSNGDIDWIITEMMTDPNLVTSTSNITVPQQQVSVNSSLSSLIKQPSPDTSSSLKSSPGSMSSYLSSSVPVGNTVVFGSSRHPTPGIPCATSVKNVITTQPQLVVSQFSQPKVGSLDATTILYDDHNTPGLGVAVFGQRSSYPLNTPKKLLGDLFTRTKNPVLPSIYTDSTLIVPEPRVSKYHSPHQSLQMFESDFMDIDSFLKGGGGGGTSNTGDGKDIPESIFNM